MEIKDFFCIDVDRRNPIINLTLFDCIQVASKGKHRNQIINHVGKILPPLVL